MDPRHRTSKKLCVVRFVSRSARVETIVSQEKVGVGFSSEVEGSSSELVCHAIDETFDNVRYASKDNLDV